MAERRTTRASGRIAASTLAGAMILDGIFFTGFWGRNAAGLGRTDMGLALAFSFAVPLSLYGCLVLGSVSALCAAQSLFRHRPALCWLAATAVTLVPVAFILLQR